MPFTYGGIVEDGEHMNKKYEMLGLSEIYLDYAGRFPRTHSIHRHLAEIETGGPVYFYRNNEKLEIRNHGGQCLGRLSNQGADKWMDRLGSYLGGKGRGDAAAQSR